VDSVIDDLFDESLDAPGGDVVEDGGFTFNLLAVHGVVGGGGGVAEGADAREIVQAEDGLHEMR
jgi:hypothetical protein